jgi:transcriptional regulator with XRE-family HTH domain
VVSSLGQELKARRRATGLTQGAVADRLGVARPTLTQWESDTHRPKPEHLTMLDELYGAQGQLVRLAQTGHTEGDIPQQGHRRLLADIFRDVADALVGSLVLADDGRPLGWSSSLGDSSRTPTPLSTAFVVRTLQLLDEARVDLRGLAQFFEDSDWRYTSVDRPGPEVTAVLLAAHSRLGGVTDVDSALRQLEDGIDEFALTRPYVISVVLETLLAIRPDSPLTHRLLRDLLKARQRYHDRLLWTMDASAEPELVNPSLAHTARATAVLRRARPTTDDQNDVDEAIDMAVEWMVSLDRSDDNVIEVLPPATPGHAASLPIHHFTAAWTIRALAGVEGVPATRLDAALDVLWDSYSPTANLWVWRDDGTLPAWMTHDAVSALRILAEVSLSTPVWPTSHGDNT